MIHRAPFGSMERFMGILIEHFAGAFPLWLAPEQVRVLPISDKVADYADRVLAELKAAGLRAAVDRRPEKIGAKIRDAQLEKIPVMLVVGAKEAEAGHVAYRDRIDGDLGALPLADAIARLKAETDARTIRQVGRRRAARAGHAERGRRRSTSIDGDGIGYASRRDLVASGSWSFRPYGPFCGPVAEPGGSCSAIIASRTVSIIGRSVSMVFQRMSRSTSK